MHRFFALSLAWLASTVSTAQLPNRQSDDVPLNPSLSGPVVPMSSSAGAGTYARATWLQDNTILGAYALSEGGNNTLTLVSATYADGATSAWTQVGTAATRESATADLDNPFPLQLANGTILLAYRNHDRNSTSPNAYTYFRITISYSDDNGASWHYLSEPVSYAGTQYHGAWEPFLRQANDGSIQMYWSQEYEQSNQDLLMLSSTDGGVTWGNQITVSGDGITSRDGMVGIAPITTVAGDPTPLIGIFESADTAEGGTGRFTVYSVKSYDDGLSWSDRELVYSPNGTLTNAGAPQIANVGGALVASFMTDEDTQAQDWANGASAKMLTSATGEEGSWDHKLEVFGSDSYWPALLTLDDTDVLYMDNFGGVVSQVVTLS